MTFLAAESTVWMIFISTLAVAAGLIWLEWQRQDRRYRTMRIAFTATAVAALTLLGIRPAWRQESSLGATPAVEAVVWNASEFDPLPETIRNLLKRIPVAHRFGFQGTVPPHAEQPTVIPDLGYLHRHFPEVKKIHLVGDGLLPSELQALNDCEVTFLPRKTTLTAPTIGFLSCPRKLPFGSPLVVQGRIDGLAPDATVVVSVEGPDGSVSASPVISGGPDAHALFQITTAPLPSLGKFIWKLRLSAPGKEEKVFASEEFGVSLVEAPALRMLVLESSPHSDTAVLRRWLESAGGAMTVRTKIGLNQYRFTATGSAPRDFTDIDAPLLAGFDLLLIDPATLSTLSAAELTIIRKNVETDGGGVLITGIPPLPPNDGNDSAPILAENDPLTFFSPWKLLLLESAGQEENPATRLVRPHWQGQAPSTDVLLPSGAAEIISTDESTDALVTDGQGHTLSARVQRGRGQIGLTLLGETRRWLAENDPAAFAEYWSLVLSKLSKHRNNEQSGQWSLDAGNGEPFFANEPLKLMWTGPSAAELPALIVSDENPAVRTEIALAQNSTDFQQWSGTFWPRAAGWHRVTLPANGASMDFYVSSQGAWKHLRRMNRNAATERFALRSERPPESLSPVVTVSPVSPWWWYAALLLSVTFLWSERYWDWQTQKTNGANRRFFG